MLEPRVTGRNTAQPSSYLKSSHEAAVLQSTRELGPAQESRQGPQATLVTLRQLRGGWAALLDQAASKQATDKNPRQHTRPSGSENGKISRWKAEGMGLPASGFEAPNERSSAAHTRTERERQNTTRGGSDSKFTRKQSKQPTMELPPRPLTRPSLQTFRAASMFSAPAERSPRSSGRNDAPNLAAGWGAGTPSQARLANGRTVTAQIPVHSPALDMAHNFQGGASGLQAPGLHASAQSLAEFALSHAGHSIESLLKKAYRLDSRSQLSQPQAMRFFALILKIGGDFTFEHSTRVLDLAMDLADELGVDEETRRQVELGAWLKDMGEMALLLDQAPPEKLDEMSQWLSGQDLRQAGLLHDIGKTQLPPEILYKPGRLTDQEYELMKLHPILGERMLFPIKALRHLCPIVRGHHERWDGLGYPDGLKGEQIPMGARIIAIADVFDALMADRPYKAAMPVEKVRDILQAGRGTHFDPALSDAFGRVLQRRYPELGNPFE